MRGHGNGRAVRRGRPREGRGLGVETYRFRGTRGLLARGSTRLRDQAHGAAFLGRGGLPERFRRRRSPGPREERGRRRRVLLRLGRRRRARRSWRSGLLASGRGRARVVRQRARRALRAVVQRARARRETNDGRRGRGRVGASAGPRLRPAAVDGEGALGAAPRRHGRVPLRRRRAGREPKRGLRECAPEHPVDVRGRPDRGVGYSSPRNIRVAAAAFAATRLHGISASRPRRSRDSRRNIHATGRFPQASTARTRPSPTRGATARASKRASSS